MSQIYSRFKSLFFGAFFWSLFLLIFAIGVSACFDIGQSWDEGIERLTLSNNLAAIRGLLSGDTTQYQLLLQYGDRYYGIGFHLLAQFFSTTFQYLIPINTQEAQIGLAHTWVLLCFIGSSLLVRLTLLRLTMNRNLAQLGMVMYLLWPYLWGHALMNVKDMPFLFAWLLCTYLALMYLFPNSMHLEKTRIDQKKIIVALGIVTGWLLSIRIAGILIFIEYTFLFVSALIFNFRYTKKLASITHPREIFCALLLFAIVSITTLITLYPISWHNPLEIFNAITYMSHHPWEGTTLTAGRFMSPGKQVGLYLFIWFLAKTPLLVLIGLALSPRLLFKKTDHHHSNRINSSALAQWAGLALSVVAIIGTLIIQRVGLYNEVRQVLFLFPLIFMLGISSIFIINNKLAYIGMIISCFLFTWDSVTLYPYNYTYVNEIARLRPATQYFETDYFGISAGKSARWINNQSTSLDAKCIYAYPIHLISYELNTNKYRCLIDSQGNANNLKKGSPSLLFITQRNLINFPIPSNCQLIHSEERTLPLSKNPLIMGKIFYCD